jgi:transposase InsO family protein
MAKGVVPMDVLLRIAVASPDVNVSAFCREHGINRDTFYVWRKRYLEEGVAGLEARSRAPKSSPQRIDPAIEGEIIRLRKQLDEDGDYHGAVTIHWHLGRQGWRSVPSMTTVWRVLGRHGFIEPQPHKRPKASFRRFEASAPNELWQTDFTEWMIRTGLVKIFSFLDDHSRVALRLRAVLQATTEAAWTAFCEAAWAWGTPLGQLSDNGLCFSGKLRGFEVHFETQLRAIGVMPMTSRPFHPQTCGKVERFQQTLKKWLARQPLAGDLDEIQAQLDTFADHYNHHRPHQGIGRRTPVERWMATPPAINLGTSLPGPARQREVLVSRTGEAPVRPWRINVGTRWAGHTAQVSTDDTHFAVFIGGQLIAAGAIDPTRSYQGLKGRSLTVG